MINEVYAASLRELATTRHSPLPRSQPRDRAHFGSTLEAPKQLLFVRYIHDLPQYAVIA